MVSKTKPLTGSMVHGSKLEDLKHLLNKNQTVEPSCIFAEPVSLGAKNIGGASNPTLSCEFRTIIGSVLRSTLNREPLNP